MEGREGRRKTKDGRNMGSGNVVEEVRRQSWQEYIAGERFLDPLCQLCNLDCAINRRNIPVMQDMGGKSTLKMRKRAISAIDP